MAFDAFFMLKLKQTNYLSLLKASSSFGNDLLQTLSCLRLYTASMIDFLIEESDQDDEVNSGLRRRQLSNMN